MAHIELDESSRRYRIRFRYGGKEYKRSLKTTSEGEANSILGRVEETVRLLERGRMVLPSDADAGTFILSDGKRNGKPIRQPILTLKDLLTGYHKSLPEGTKAESTIDGEKIHHQHLLRHLGATTIAKSVGATEVQEYVRKRLHEKYRGKPIHPDTVKKELTTLRLIWNWGVVQGCLSGPSPTKGVKLPRRAEKPPFMTRDEIQKIIDRGGVCEADQKTLWCKHVPYNHRNPGYPWLCWTGCYSSICVSHVRLRCPHWCPAKRNPAFSDRRLRLLRRGDSDPREKEGPRKDSHFPSRADDRVCYHRP